MAYGYWIDPYTFVVTDPRFDPDRSVAPVMPTQTGQQLLQRLNSIPATVAAGIHSMSWWTGVVGGLVLMLNRALGLGLSSTATAAVAGVVASLVLGGHYVAGKVATMPATSAAPATTSEAK